MVTSPQNNTNYNTDRLNLTINSKEMMEKLEYSLDGRRYRSLTLGKNKNQYNGKINVNDDGNHTLTIKATYPCNNIITKTINFFIDSTKPRIIKQEPRNKKYCNGNFKVEYSEEYLKNVYLYYGNDVSVKDNCSSGRNQECEFNVPLAQYENKSIKFHFEVEDTFWKIPYRMNYTCLVDTIPPKFTYFNWTVDGRYLYLNISLDEKAKSLGYIDYYDSRKTERNLCSNCNEYGASRVKKVSVRKGYHNLTITAEDEAGNKETKNINVIVDY